MAKLSTKERIIEEALSLFSEKGYESVSVIQIASAVGIKAPSLYKHYKSKKDIFNAIIETMTKQFQPLAASVKMDGSNPDKDAELFLDISDEKLIEMGKELLRYYLHDDFICKVRRLLMIEQYNSSKLAELYKKQFIETPISYQSAIFALLIKKGVMKAGDSKMMAINFFAPIFLLLSICDSNPNEEKEAMKILEQHIKEFNSLYRKY